MNSTVTAKYQTTIPKVVRGIEGDVLDIFSFR